MITLDHGTLPTTSYLALHAQISGTEASEVLAVMRRSLHRFGPSDTLREMLAAYGFSWRPATLETCSRCASLGYSAPRPNVCTACRSPRRVKRDEFACPCCGRPTDSSYCTPCDEAECGEQDVGAPDMCLAAQAAEATLDAVARIRGEDPRRARIVRELRAREAAETTQDNEENDDE